MTKAEIGTVSHATMRNEDLLEAFADELERLDEPTGAMADDYQESERKLIAGARGVDPDTGAASLIVRDLFVALDAYAPPYCYALLLLWRT
jgi:hypothetical protein